MTHWRGWPVDGLDEGPPPVRLSGVPRNLGLRSRSAAA